MRKFPLYGKIKVMFQSPPTRHLQWAFPHPPFAKGPVAGVWTAGVKGGVTALLPGLGIVSFEVKKGPFQAPKMEIFPVLSLGKP